MHRGTAESGTDLTLGAFLTAWSWRPDVLLVLIALGTTYTSGWWRLRNGGARVARPWRLATYLAGLGSLGLALLSPIEALGSQLFLMHMVQHELLIMVASPLLLLANPFPILLWGVPRKLRLAVRLFLARGAMVRRILHIVTWMPVAWGAYVVNLWGWHIPAAYESALKHEFIHHLEHLTFFGTALLFWWPIINPAPRLHGNLAYSFRILYILAATFQTVALGFAIAVTERVLYPSNTAAPGFWQLSPLDDQAYGGAIMSEAGMMFLIPVLVLVNRWLNEEEQKARLRELLKLRERGLPVKGGRGRNRSMGTRLVHYPLMPFLAVALLVALASPASAYMHQTSRIRFLEYSTAAFSQAGQEGKPVFLLISAIWCYWCKTFEKETLRTKEVSEYLNRFYLNVFVDYDRRPDLVKKYVRGIPMVVLFSPRGRVVQSFAGALKKEDFLAVLTRVEGEVRTELARPPSPEPAAAPVPLPPPLPVSGETYRQLLDGLTRYLDEQADTTYGGFGVGAKGPYGRLLAFYLEQTAIIRDSKHRAMVDKTLAGILRSLYDPVEGGFFHYATGRDWTDPRYEKMLYANAALVVVFDKAHQLTQDPRYKEAAHATITYLLRTLYDAKQGGFYSSQASDPAYYRLSAQARHTAVRPPVIRDKVTASNAEAVLAFLTVGQSTGRKDLNDAAFRSLEFLRRHLLTEKGMYHIYEQRTGRGLLRGQLEANAWAALVFLEGHRASGRIVYRQAAEQLLRYALAELFDPQRGAFVEESNPDDRGPRSKEAPVDGNGVMALALLRAHQVTGRGEYLEIGTRILATLGGEVKTVLVDEPDTTPVRKVADTVYYLRAYGQALQKP